MPDSDDPLLEISPVSYRTRLRLGSVGWTGHILFGTAKRRRSLRLPIALERVGSARDQRLPIFGLSEDSMDSFIATMAVDVDAGLEG